MKVLIIPEDQELDQYILKPVIEAMFADMGRPARVQILPDPRLRGTADALDRDVIAGIVAARPMIDLFLLIVDLDCDREGNARKAMARAGEHPNKLLACLARHEVEVWMLALHAEKLEAKWGEVRNECDPKERFAEPLLAALGSVGPGRGRKQAMRALAGNYGALVNRCDELQGLRDAVRAWWDARV